MLKLCNFEGPELVGHTCKCCKRSLYVLSPSFFPFIIASILHFKNIKKQANKQMCKMNWKYCSSWTVHQGIPYYILIYAVFISCHLQCFPLQSCRGHQVCVGYFKKIEAALFKILVKFRHKYCGISTVLCAVPVIYCLVFKIASQWDHTAGDEFWGIDLDTLHVTVSLVAKPLNK